VLVPVRSERTAAPDSLKELCRQINPAAPSVVCSSLEAALDLLNQQDLIVISGSLYLVGEALELLQSLPAPSVPQRALNEWMLAGQPNL
jgi:folylpolyglutamate synthase/dihydropteroate synthase